VESGICARKGWGSRLQKARTATNVCFHLLSQATLRALPNKSPLQSAAQLREKITEAVIFVKNVYYMACKERWSLATPLIAADSSSHIRFSRQESQLLLHSRPSGFSAGTFNTTCYSMPGWSGSGIPDLFPFRTSAGGTSHWNKLGFFGSIEWHICKKVPHLISIRTMEFDHVYCIAISAGGHTSDSHLAIQFVIQVCVCGASLLAPRPHHCFSCIDWVNNHTQSHMVLQVRLEMWWIWSKYEL